MAQRKKAKPRGALGEVRRPSPAKTEGEISTFAAPAAIGPYVQARAAGGWLFCSGQIGLDPDSGTLVSGGARPEAERVLRNLEAVLAAAGAGLAHVVKTTIYLVDMVDFADVNDVYAEAF